jgi:hypothetical protein
VLQFPIRDTNGCRQVAEGKLPLCLTNQALRQEDVWGVDYRYTYFLDLEVSGKLHALAILPS